MELVRRPRMPLPLLLLCLVAVLGGARPSAAASRRKPALAPTPAPTPAPAQPTGGTRLVIDAPERCPDGQAMYHNACRMLRGPAPQG